MSAAPSARIVALAGVPAPELDSTAFVAPGAVIVGAVRLAARSSVWYNAVLRAEAEPISLGERSNLQDTVVCHVDRGFPLTIGADVSVGHGAVLHGCTIEDGSLIGMNATVLNGAVIGAGSLVAAGAVVLEGTIVPPGSLVAGVPAKVRRELTAEERASLHRNAQSYLGHAGLHAAPVD
ncbi:carbonic anhydrase/acetyltransferase-like protein (isoleucine patch superfamily) [Agromyces terreus]|uniref:Carbonic anhydrase/acetyltransferase-like protein (Isoleucine patch superfamily) n=1 Tax=Agromyces terreus TaxID=424795 RepID=A0A9X2GVJ6_9MICO|nr:gamma carbonic anhydrase family protein [Agromyces terreus]MCP2369382.1 carbonic anhydrase/acetyltransferase-like protein (isoleucine patch superfamily) [Agromyces terreus]